VGEEMQNSRRRRAERPNELETRLEADHQLESEQRIGRPQARAQLEPWQQSACVSVSALTFSSGGKKKSEVK